MNIFPAIDLYDKKAVRLFKGDYNQMTVYSENPIDVARDFEEIFTVSKERTSANFKRGFFGKIFDAILRVFEPLL